MNHINLVMGTMTFGESVFHPDADQFVTMFLNAGFDELDTAYVYNEGQSEKLLGDILKKIDRSNVKIASKVNPRISGKLDGEAAHLQLNSSLERLEWIMWIPFLTFSGSIHTSGVCVGGLRRTSYAG
ncbi:MAG: aldo/keto reductase [Eisenbergiella sp.]